jgi:hypothetical protein
MTTTTRSADPVRDEIGPIGNHSRFGSDQNWRSIWASVGHYTNREIAQEVRSLARGYRKAPGKSRARMLGWSIRPTPRGDLCLSVWMQNGQSGPDTLSALL